MEAHCRQGPSRVTAVEDVGARAGDKEIREVDRRVAMSASELPRLPEYCLSFDYEDYGEQRELTAACPRCRHRQRTGLLLGEPVPESVVNRIKDRLLRYHDCPSTSLSALAEADFAAALDAFGFPDWLRNETPSRPTSHKKWGPTQ